MKKHFLITSFLCLFALSLSNSFAQAPFYDAVRTCEEYSQTGTVKHNGESFNITVSLNKTKANKCIYKEKIHQGKDYQMLTCEFELDNLVFISDSMKRFNEYFKKQIAQNKIFEAKMTTNGEVFQRYLADPKYCKITHSKK